MSCEKYFITFLDEVVGGIIYERLITFSLFILLFIIAPIVIYVVLKIKDNKDNESK